MRDASHSRAYSYAYTEPNAYGHTDTYDYTDTYATAAIYRRWWRRRRLNTETTMYQWHCRTQPLCQCRPGQRLRTASNHQGHPGGTHQYRHALELE